MKMFATVSLVVLGLTSGSVMAGSTEYKVDPAASKVEWLGKKVAGQHNGTIALKSGTVKFNGKKLAGGKILIDMTSIKNLDIADPEYNQKLIGHLASDDFFSTAKHAESVLVIKSVKERSADELDVQGDLTIKGKTLPISFPAKVAVNGDAVSASGKMVIDRTQYGIRYGSGKFFQNLGDKMIDDQFELTFSLNARK